MANRPPLDEIVVLKGVLRQEIFRSPDDTYTVALLEVKGEPGTRTVVGDLMGCKVGDTVEIHGSRGVHARFGEQIRVQRARWVPPSSKEGIRRFLARKSVAGVGKALAKRIVSHFGTDTLKVLAEEPERLREVDGIGKRKAAEIEKVWRKGQARFEEAAFLSGLGLGPALIERVRQVFGDRILEVVRSNPFLLARKVEGVGFLRADEMARGMGIEESHPMRLQAGIEHVLREGMDEGHVFAMGLELVKRAAELLGLPSGPVQDRLQELLEQGELGCEELEGDRAIYLPHMLSAECEVARDLTARLEEPEDGFDADVALSKVEPRLGITLTPDQRSALVQLLGVRCGVLTGGPGVGKTTLTRALVQVFGDRGLKVGLAAPTGRAARRLTECCGRPAQTIHRLLGFNPHERGFQHDRDRPLEYDALLVDESSMIDLLLMRALLRAVQFTTRLILIGDADQLPSVGPGDVLRSIVGSQRLCTVRLTRILRQREESSIVHAAHEVLAGQEPQFQKQPGEGAFFVARDNPAGVVKTVVDLVKSRIPQSFSLDPLKDIQVLSPMNRGPLGTRSLNRELKVALNPSEDDKSGRLFAGDDEEAPSAHLLMVGDRVLQTKNDYDLEV